MSKPPAAMTQSYNSTEVFSADAKCGKTRFALVIPTLSEAENISRLLDEVRRALDPTGVFYEVVVVDDESCDGTGELVKQIAETDPRVRLLVREGKRGLSGAILHGWKHTDADVLGVMDADLQHPPALLPQLLHAILENKDMAIGSRYTAGGGLGEWNCFRKLASLLAVWMTWPLQSSAIRMRDPLSGFFLVRRSCLRGLDFQQQGFKLLLEILVRGRIGSVQEVPFVFGRRACGDSKASVRVAMDFMHLLMRLYVNRFRSLSPRWRTTTSQLYSGD
jgi:dolichol-phosphate mannosyltransferase